MIKVIINRSVEISRYNPNIISAEYTTREVYFCGILVFKKDYSSSPLA